MDPDDTHRRPSVAHDRPSRAPFGPRIRTKTRHPQDGLASPPDSPAISTTLSIDASLAPPSPTAHVDAAVQAPSTPPPPSFFPSSSSPSPSPPTLPSKPTSTPPKSSVGTFIAPPPLTPPPAIAFESTPIPWKGLPFEAAQWSFSSEELQEIVSQAIRLSARESFVRLLSLQALEVDVVQEKQRLDHERVTAQAKWRFEVGRRTMLMQALNSSAASSSPAGEADPVLGFVGQLAASIAACDSLLSSILHFSDQQSQIALIQHQHWASALGIALRKLNRAYERQGDELRRAHARVQTLEDELEEAWREAEKMAIEFDDLEQEVQESGSEGMDLEADTDPDAGADVLEHFGPAEARQDMDETGTLGDVTINTDIAVVLGVTATAVASKATLVTSSGSPKLVDKFDTKSIRSVKSSRSRRDGPSYTSRLSAARTRSRAASNASLRLPKALRAPPPTYAPPTDAPPIPALPSTSGQDRSFLDMGNVTPDPVRRAIPPKRSEPTLALPTPPHSAGLPPTRVPSIWLETDGGKSTRLNGLDRTHSLHIFSSLTGRTPKKARRSNLVMSLTGSDHSSEGASPVEASGSADTSMVATGAGIGTTTAGSTAGTASPTSNSSPISLPTHALAHFRNSSLGSSSRSVRPGSAGARLTSTGDTLAPKKSLVSRASSVILRRLSQATARREPASPSSRRRGGSARGRAAVQLGREEEEEEEEEEEGYREGEVMLIGSPHADPFDT